MERVLLIGELAIAESSWRLKELSSNESYSVLPQSHKLLGYDDDDSVAKSSFSIMPCFLFL